MTLTQDQKVVSMASVIREMDKTELLQLINKSARIIMVTSQWYIKNYYTSVISYARHQLKQL